MLCSAIPSTLNKSYLINNNNKIFQLVGHEQIKGNDEMKEEHRCRELNFDYFEIQSSNFDDKDALVYGMLDPLIGKGLVTSGGLY